jgi:metal-sulfur cluster biosynthetic enzyme
MAAHSDSDKIQIEVYNTLKNVIDPELGLNIIDLGLVYEIKHTPDSGIKIKMTLSIKGCPMG